MATEDYWDIWEKIPALFTEVDEACTLFLADRPGWSSVANRWDNADRLLSGPIRNGVLGNIHILLLPDKQKLRFTHAAWRDQDDRLEGAHRTFTRYWSTSDETTGDLELDASSVQKSQVLDLINKAWESLQTLSTLPKARVNKIKLPV